MDLKRGEVELERQIAAKDRDLARIPADQTRIRENMKVVDKSTDYYNDLLKKLRAQETELETLQQDTAKLRAELDGQKKKLEDYLKDLTF
jgi:chromosome segregation ATPase